MMCDVCKQDRDDAVETIDPYAQDIDGVEIEMVLCPVCYQAALR